MHLNDIIERAKADFTLLSNSPVDGITSFGRSDGEWILCLEVLERRAIPDCMDVLGVYEVRLDSEGNITNFARKKLRKRGDTGESA
ncbi:MAG: gas vesicle protein [Chloroflexi bacterium]|nr:gas vesicle protein [Chloroflexota bacterium]